MLGVGGVTWGENSKLLTFEGLALFLPNGKELIWRYLSGSSQSFRATSGSLRAEVLKTNWEFCSVYHSYCWDSVQWRTCFSGFLSSLLLFSFQPLYAPTFLARHKILCNWRALQSWHSSFCSYMGLYVLFHFTQFRLDGKKQLGSLRKACDMYPFCPLIYRSAYQEQNSVGKSNI